MSRKAWLKITIFAIHSPFLLPSFFRRERKGENDNQSLDFRSCLSVRLNVIMPSMIHSFFLHSLEQYKKLLLFILTCILWRMIYNLTPFVCIYCPFSFLMSSFSWKRTMQLLIKRLHIMIHLLKIYTKRNILSWSFVT